MFWWRALLKRVRPFRGTLVAAAFVVLLLLAAKLHACACTGGKPQWRSLSADSPSTQTSRSE